MDDPKVFFLTEPNICQQTTPYLIVTILSEPANYHRRESIRRRIKEFNAKSDYGKPCSLGPQKKYTVPFMCVQILFWTLSQCTS